MFSLLKPTFSLLYRPHPFPLVLQPKTERSPTDNTFIILFLKDSSIYLTASASYLVPFIFGAGLLDQ